LDPVYRLRPRPRKARVAIEPFRKRERGDEYNHALAKRHRRWCTPTETRFDPNTDAAQKYSHGVGEYSVL
jgi:hypothetical protein